MKLIISQFKKIWHDPVFSQLIGGGLTALLIFIWGLLSAKTLLLVVYWILKGLATTTPLWAIILIAGSIWIGTDLMKKKPDLDKKKQLWNEKVGNRTFEELYNILSTEKLREQTETMKLLGKAAPEDTLLKHFIFNYEEFKAGVAFGDLQTMHQWAIVNRNDGGYLIELLGPRLVELELLYLEKDNNPMRKLSTYRISEVGYCFYDLFNEIFSEET